MINVVEALFRLSCTRSYCAVVLVLLNFFFFSTCDGTPNFQVYSAGIHTEPDNDHLVVLSQKPIASGLTSTVPPLGGGGGGLKIT